MTDQLPATGADAGLQANGAHLVLPTGCSEDVVLAATATAMHNCGD